MTRCQIPSAVAHSLLSVSLTPGDGPQISVKAGKGRVIAAQFLATEFCEISSCVMEGF
jgi:hypothetical protein